MIANAREGEADQAGLDVALGQVVRELVGRDPERDDERQVEQQLERRRGAVGLVRVAPLHPGPAVLEQRGHADMRVIEKCHARSRAN